MAKARADGLRGIMVVPFSPAIPAWPTLMAASLSSSPGQLDRCITVSASEQYVARHDDLGGAQRLAIFAVDFSRFSTRSFAGLAPACPRTAELRPRPALRYPLDDHDMRRIAAELYSRGLHKRAADAPATAQPHRARGRRQ